MTTKGTPSNDSKGWEDRLPIDLVNKIKAGRCVAFVGAGFSFPANVRLTYIIL